MEEDWEAALEWQEYQNSLCSGCGFPRHETFAASPAGVRDDERYDVDVLTCHACAGKDRKAYNRNSSRESGEPPPFGEYYAVRDPD